MATNFFVVMRLTEQVSRPLRRAASSANQMTDAADRMSTQLQASNAVLVGTAAAATAVVGALSSSAAHLENSIARLETVTRSTSGSIQTALSNAEASAREFSSQYTTTASEFLDAQFQIATAGIAVEEQVAATAGAFKLARATLGEFTQSAQLVGSFLNTFGKAAEFNYLRPAEKVEAITDRLTTAVQRFQVTLPVLAESFKFIVGPASTLNLNLGEVTAAIGVLNTAGFRGTLAGTALSNVFNKLDRAVEKLDLNPDKFIDLNGELKDMTSFFEELNRVLADFTPIEKQNKLIQTFDIRAGRVIKTILDNVDALKQFRGELDISTGATERLANIVENTTSSQFKKFFNQLQNIATIIGGTLNTVLRPLAKSLAETTKSVAAFVERNKVWISSLLAGGTALLGIVVAGSALKLIFGTLISGIGALVVKSGLLKIAFVALQTTLLLTSNALKALVFTSKLAILATVRFSVAVKAATLTVNIFKLALIAASRAAVVFAGRALAAMTAALGPIGALLAAAAAAGLAVAAAARGLHAAFSATATATERASLSLEELDKNFGNSIERASSLSNELTRLGKTVRDNIELPLRGGEQLGELPFAKEATRILKERIKFGEQLERPFDIRLGEKQSKRAAALMEAAEAASGFEGIIRQFSNAMGQASQVNIAYANTLKKIKEEADRTFSALDDVQKSDAVTKDLFIGGGAVALQGLSKGNEQAAQAIAGLISDYRKLGEQINNADVRAAVTNRIFERITANLDELRDSSNKGVQELIAFFDKASQAADSFQQNLAKQIRTDDPSISKNDAISQAIEQTGSFALAGKKAFEELTADSTAFFKILQQTGPIRKIADDFVSLQKKGGLLKGSVDGIHTAISQTSSATKSVANLFENAALGGESFSKAQKVAAERITQAEDSFNRVSAAIKTAENFLERYRDTALAGTPIFKDAEDFVKGAGDIELDLRTRINDAQALQEANRIFGLIDQANKAFTADQVADIKALGGAFASTIGDALTGATRGADVFSSLADAFKKQFVGEIQKDIALLFGNKFKDQIRSAVNVARGVIEKAELTGSLFAGLQTGQLQQDINAAIQAAVPGIKQITSGDIFNLTEGNKLAEQFRNAFTDTSVALVTAGNRSAAILEQLQSALAQGPGQNRSALIRQATLFRNLLKEASVTGATDAVRPLQQALADVLAQIQQSGPPTAVQQIATATQQSTNAIENSSSRFANVIQTLAPAAAAFINTIEEGFRRIQETDLGKSAAGLIETFDVRSGRVIDVNIESNGNLNVTVESTSTGGGTGTGTLEEDEIRDIVAETKTELLQELEDRLQKLEDELRSR